MNSGIAESLIAQVKRKGYRNQFCILEDSMSALYDNLLMIRNGFNFIFSWLTRTYRMIFYKTLMFWPFYFAFFQEGDV